MCVQAERKKQDIKVALASTGRRPVERETLDTGLKSGKIKVRGCVPRGPALFFSCSPPLPRQPFVVHVHVHVHVRVRVCVCVRACCLLLFARLCVCRVRGR